MAPRLILSKAQKSARGHATYSAEEGMLAGYVQGTLTERVAAYAVIRVGGPVLVFLQGLAILLLLLKR
jgi:hypothetical protein